MIRRILVGVDGSPDSARALRWAVAEVAGPDTAVDAVIVWQSPYDFGDAVSYASVDLDDLARAARATLTDTVGQVAGGADAAARVHPVVLEGDPAEVLCNLSDGADLLVVGSRGRGGFARLALGSVSTKCAHHSRCPVVIVPSARRSR